MTASFWTRAGRWRRSTRFSTANDRTGCFIAGAADLHVQIFELLVWQGSKVEEQRLLLSMMQSCGICFLHREADDEDENEYIAPDLLPERSAVDNQIAAMWDAHLPAETAEFEYPLLHSGHRGQRDFAYRRASRCCGGVLEGRALRL